MRSARSWSFTLASTSDDRNDRDDSKCDAIESYR